MNVRFGEYINKLTCCLSSLLGLPHLNSDINPFQIQSSRFHQDLMQLDAAISPSFINLSPYLVPSWPSWKGTRNRQQCYRAKSLSSKGGTPSGRVDLVSLHIVWYNGEQGQVRFVSFWVPAFEQTFFESLSVCFLGVGSPVYTNSFVWGHQLPRRPLSEHLHSGWPFRNLNARMTQFRDLIWLENLAEIYGPWATKA